MYVLHSSPDSASLIVRLVLNELELPYRDRLIDRDGGELQTEAYRRLHPLGLIPALETPDGVMFETAAILLWLAEQHPGLAPAPGSPERANFLKWFIFTNNSIHTNLLQLFYPDRVAGEAATPDLLVHARKRMRSYLGLLNEMVAAEAPEWLSPAQPSILGYYVGVLMRWLGMFGAGHPSNIHSTEFPALHAVLAALEVRPAARAAADVEALGPTIFTAPAI